MATSSLIVITVSLTNCNLLQSHNNLDIIHVAQVQSATRITALSQDAGVRMDEHHVPGDEKVR